MAGGSLTRADVEAWNTEHLDTAATHWSSTAQAWEEHFTTIHNGMTRPGGTTWEGAGADAASERSWMDLVTVRGAADALHSASAHATNGSGDVAWAKRRALNAITEAEEDGFTVGQDLSLKDTSTPSLLSDGEDRQSKAKEHAHAIQAAVQQLVDADKQTADRIHGALFPLNGVKFPGHDGDGNHDPTVEAVDYQKPKEPPQDKPGADDNGGLAGLLGVPDPAKKPDEKSPWTQQRPPAEPDKPTNPLDLLAGKDGKDGKSDAASEHPRTLQDMMLPSGPPAAAGPASEPKFDPKTPEGRAGLAMARQVLMNDPRVPPGEVEQRLAAMTAQAQQPLPPPPVHEPGPKPPIPGFGERLGDKFNNFTNSIHEGFYERGRETLTGIENLTGLGGPGHPGVGESWKQLAHGTIDDIRNDPLRYDVAQREGHAMVEDPGRYAGKTLFDGTVAAATAPLAGEGLLARGAAEGAVTHGLEHGIEHGVVHDATPVAPHPPADLPVAPHGPVEVPATGDHGLIGHGGDTAPPPLEHHSPLEDMLLGGHHDANPVEVPPTHTPPSPDAFDLGQGSHYNSGDPYHPGNWPPHTPESTWQKGDTEPGWRHVNRGPDKPWMDFQGQVGGIERTPEGHLPEYVRTDPTTGKPVEYDAQVFRGPQEVYLEAKDGHRGMAFAPDSTYWEGRADKTLEQVERQLRALPPDAILEWHVSDPYGAAAIRKLFEANGIYDVSVIYTPRVP
ncbi:hypothetical protein ACJH6H_28445 [Mycobacterium sp. SMC-21]|uniref:hypothetical protein n=1 Tax=Mycobacterium sp. SMC-21 TaxID=3381632 RepID=UPI0038771E6E